MPDYPKHLQKKSRAKTHARPDSPKANWEQYFYLLVDTGGTLVEAGEGVPDSSLLQPVSTIPIAKPSNTTRVDILFIGTRNLD